jgi:hypothetical protein
LKGMEAAWKYVHQFDTKNNIVACVLGNATVISRFRIW